MLSSSVLQAYTGSTDTVALGQIEAGVVAWLQTWIPRYLGTATTLTEIHSGPQRQNALLTGRGVGERLRTLWLSEDIASGSLVSVEERTSPTADWADLPNPADLTDYEIRPLTPSAAAGRKLVRLSADFPAGASNIRVKFTHGYAEDAAPDDVTLAALQIVKALVDNKTTGNHLEETADKGGVKYAAAMRLPGVDQGLVNSLRRPRYG